MKLTSEWPLPPEGIRFQLPQFLIAEMAGHPLSQNLYPIAAGYYPRAANHRMRRAEHDSYLLIYCTDGKGLVAVEGQSWRVAAGDLLLLPKGVAHEYRANRSDPWTIYWVHYDGGLSGQYSEFINQGAPVANIGLHPRLVADFEALFSLRNAGYALRAYIHGACQLKQMLTYIALLVVRHRPQNGQPIDLDRIQELMHLRLNGRLNLEALAAEAHMSKYHFARRFKQLTGHSPIQHFIHLKMQHACVLLDTSTASIKQVASAVGYEDPYYFSRQFKQVIGVAPREYRLNRQA